MTANSVLFPLRSPSHAPPFKSAPGVYVAGCTSPSFDVAPEASVAGYAAFYP